MGKNKPIIGFILGIIVAVVIFFANIPGLERTGQMCMAFSLMTVIFWAFGIAQPGYVSGLYLLLLAVFKVAPTTLIFSTWTTSMMYLIIGAYLIAVAVKESGLGERIAYKFIVKYVSSFKSIIVSIFALTFILALLIPHPWPRAFLIMSVMAVVVKSADIPREDAVKIGFTVFTASIPVSMIFLTGDASINPLAAASCDPEPVGWLKWFEVMGLPMIVTSIITMVMILFMFKPTKEVNVNKTEILEKLKAMGPMSGKELRTAVWVTLAIILWMTDTMHGVDIGWVTLFIAMAMSMPLIGEILTPASWNGVPLHVLIFLTAAVAIGRVGGATGMNAWIAQTVLPAAVPADPYILAAFIAVMGIIIPAMITFTSQMGITPLVPALLAYSAVASHYVLPFQHLNMLVGQGEDNGMYTQKETIRLGIPFIIVIYIMTVVIEVPYWTMLGLFDK